VKPIPYTAFPPADAVVISQDTSTALLLLRVTADGGIPCALVIYNRHDGYWYADSESTHVFTRDVARKLMIALGEALR
jgi:hypothetical protein